MRWKVLLAVVVIGGIAMFVYIFLHALASPSEKLVVFGEDSSNLKAYSTLKDDFARKTGVKVTFEGATFEQSIQKADADFRSQKGAYDIVLQYNFSLAPYVRNNWVAEIGDVYSPSVLKNLRVNEGMFENALRETCFYYSKPLDTKSPAKQFGFPFAANTMLLVYNKDLFANESLRQQYKRATGKDLVPPADWSITSPMQNSSRKRSPA